jgi:hypothetical protein
MRSTRSRSITTIPPSQPAREVLVSWSRDLGHGHYEELLRRRSPLIEGASAFSACLHVFQMARASRWRRWRTRVKETSAKNHGHTLDVWYDVSKQLHASLYMICGAMVWVLGRARRSVGGSVAPRSSRDVYTTRRRAIASADWGNHMLATRTVW